MPIQAYFENIQPHIAHELQQATSQIDIAVAWFTDAELYRIVCQRAEQGEVAITLLLLNDAINNANYGLDFEQLTNLGGNIHWIDANEDSLMHNKFCIIDQQTVITGSYNWTVRAQRNDENISIVKDDANFAADFITAFAALRKKYGYEPLSQQLSIDDTLLLINLEIKALEMQISSLQDEKADMEKKIYEFNAHYNTQLGELIQQILLVKYQIAQLQVQQNPTSKSKQKHYQQTQQNYEQFNHNFEQNQQQNTQQLPDNLLRELKDKFRRATKLCYPDLVKPEFATEAQRIFVALKEAYDTNNLQKVNEILDYLENGKPFATDQTQTTKQQLQHRCQHLQQVLSQLIHDINTLKNTQTYQIIEQHPNPNEYLANLKTQLQTELNNLNNLLTSIKNEQP